MLKIYKALEFSSNESNEDLEVVIRKLEAYFTGESNETFERWIFNKRDQQQNENIDAYVTNLRNLSKTCNFCDVCRCSLIRDRMVLGIRFDEHQRTTQELLKIRQHDLRNCIDTCRSAEASKQMMAYMKRGPSDKEEISKVEMRRNQRDGASTKSRKDRDPQAGAGPKCKFCGKVHIFKKSACPAWGNTCTKCHRRNHFAAVCKADKSRVHAVYGDNSSESDCETINRVKETASAVSKKPIFTDIEINKQTVTFQVDPGATTNVVPLHVVRNIELLPTDTTLEMWNGANTQPVGKCRLNIRNPKKRKKYNIELLVVDNNSTPLLGWKVHEAAHCEL